MDGGFRVASTPAFEREFRKTSRGNARLVAGLEELIAALARDPHNRSGEYQIKKLSGQKAGDGQWRIDCASIGCDTIFLEMKLCCIRSATAKKLINLQFAF